MLSALVLAVTGLPLTRAATGLSQAPLTRRAAVELVPSAAVAAASVVAAPSCRPAVAAPSPQTFKVPTLGVGAWAWGDALFWGYDKRNDYNLREVFDYCIDHGTRFFDTAEVYGFGRSETLIGSFCRDNPKASDVSIATKFAALPWRRKPADVLDAARRSTDRLGCPIDLYQIHFPNAYANQAYWDGLAQAVDDGLVKAAGVSNYGVDALRACHAYLKSRGVRLVSNQIQMSLLYPFPLRNGLKAACDDLGVAVLAYSPLALGLLTGKYTKSSLPSGPRQALAKQYLQDPAYTTLLATLRAVGDTGHGGATPAQVALAWCIAKGTCPIPGARSVAQAKSNLAARAIKLTSVEVAALDDAAAAVQPVLNPDLSPFSKKDVGTGLRMFDS